MSALDSITAEFTEMDLRASLHMVAMHLEEDPQRNARESVEYLHKYFYEDIDFDSWLKEVRKIAESEGLNGLVNAI